MWVWPPSQDVHAHEVATGRATLAGATAAPFEDVVVELGGRAVADAEVGAHDVVGTGCGCCWRGRRHRRRAPPPVPVAATVRRRPDRRAAPPAAAAATALRRVAPPLGARRSPSARRRCRRRRRCSPRPSPPRPRARGGSRRCGASGPPGRRVADAADGRGVRREPGFLQRDVGDVVGGHAAVGRGVGVVVTDVRLVVVELVVVVGRRRRVGRTSACRRSRARAAAPASPVPGLRRLRPPREPRRRRRFGVRPSDRCRRHRPWRGRTAALGVDRGVGRASRRGRRCRVGRRCCGRSLPCGVLRCRGSWRAVGCGPGRRRRSPPGSSRRTSVPSLMMRSSRGRARTRRLPAAPAARRRVRSIGMFSVRGAR